MRCRPRYSDARDITRPPPLERDPPEGQSHRHRHRRHADSRPPRAPRLRRRPDRHGDHHHRRRHRALPLYAQAGRGAILRVRIAARAPAADLARATAPPARAVRADTALAPGGAARAGTAQGARGAAAGETALAAGVADVVVVVAAGGAAVRTLAGVVWREGERSTRAGHIGGRRRFRYHPDSTTGRLGISGTVRREQAGLCERGQSGRSRKKTRTVSPRKQQNARLFGHFWRQLVWSSLHRHRHRHRTYAVRVRATALPRYRSTLHRCVSRVFSAWLQGKGREGGEGKGGRGPTVRSIRAHERALARKQRCPECGGSGEVALAGGLGVDVVLRRAGRDDGGVEQREEGQERAHCCGVEGGREGGGGGSCGQGI